MYFFEHRARELTAYLYRYTLFLYKIYAVFYPLLSPCEQGEEQ